MATMSVEKDHIPFCPAGVAVELILGAKSSKTETFTVRLSVLVPNSDLVYSSANLKA